MDVDLAADGDFVVDRDVCPNRKRVFSCDGHSSFNRQRGFPLMVTGPSIASGAAPPTVTCSCTTTGKRVSERMVTLGGSTNLSTCNPPLIAMGMGRLKSLAAVTARIRLDTQPLQAS